MFFCFLTFSVFIYLCVSTCGYACVCGSQGTTGRSWLSSPTTWVPGITLRSSGGQRLSPLSPLTGPQSDCGFCRRCVALSCPCPEQNYGWQTMFHSSRKLFSSKSGDGVLQCGSGMPQSPTAKGLVPLSGYRRPRCLRGAQETSGHGAFYPGENHGIFVSLMQPSLEGNSLVYHRTVS